jgi:hypothetical protein
MIDVDNQPNLDDVLDALSTSTQKSKEVKKSVINFSDDLSDDDVYSFVLSQLKETIESNSEVIEQSKDMVSQAGTSDYIEAHSKLVKSQTDLLNSMLATMMDKKKLAQVDKHKTKDLELKERALDEKKPYGDGYLLPGTTNIQNNYILGNRDDIFDSMFENDPDKKAKAQRKVKELNGIVDEDVKRLE